VEVKTTYLGKVKCFFDLIEVDSTQKMCEGHSKTMLRKCNKIDEE